MQFEDFGIGDINVPGSRVTGGANLDICERINPAM
jgi:hypothetical protein